MTAITISKDKVVKPSIGNALPHFLPIVAFPLMFIAATLGGWWLLAPIIFFLAAGPLDVAFGKDSRNMDPKTTSEAQLIVYHLPVWLWAVLWPTVLVYTVWQIFVTGQHAWWESVALALILATEGQAIFLVGHELIHRRSAWERYLGEFVLASGSYPHYATEHFYIHHAYAGTPMDVGSAFKGQGFWHYFPRELKHNLIGAWAMANKRMARANLPVWHYSNPFWRYGIETFAWYAFIFAMGGWLIVLVYMFLCLFCVGSMKISNYIQHYGLRRVRLPNGRFEKVQARHSWSRNEKYSKWLFFNYQRHADHHVIASRQYPLLQHYDADLSPQMPFNHGTMFLLAIRPNKWFATIDPLVDQWREQFYPHIKNWSAYDSKVAESRPEAFDFIVEIFESAPRLAHAIEKNPEILDCLTSREFTDLEIPGGFGSNSEAEAIARSGLVRVYWTHEFGVDEMIEQLSESPVQDAVDAAQIVGNWTNDKTFQVAMHTLRGHLTPIEAGVALSNIAQAAISTVLTAAVEDLEDRSYQATDGVLAIIALGELASKETAPDFSPQLVLIHKGETHNNLDTRLRTRFVEALSILTDDSLLFAPPTGGQKIVEEFNLDDFKIVLKTETDAAKLMNYARARLIFYSGEPAGQSKYETVHRQLLTEQAVRDSLLTRLSELMVPPPEKIDGNLDKIAKWGLTQIELIAGAMQLTHFSEPSEHAIARDAKSIFSELSKTDALDNEAADSLIRTAKFWRNLTGMQRLIMTDESAFDNLSEQARAGIFKACIVDGDEELTEAIHQAVAITAGHQKVVSAKNG